MLTFKEFLVFEKWVAHGKTLSSGNIFSYYVNPTKSDIKELKEDPQSKGLGKESKSYYVRFIIDNKNKKFYCWSMLAKTHWDSSKDLKLDYNAKTTLLKLKTFDYIAGVAVITSDNSLKFHSSDTLDAFLSAIDIKKILSSKEGDISWVKQYMTGLEEYLGSVK